jgi:hypothetical protein
VVSRKKIKNFPFTTGYVMLNRCFSWEIAKMSVLNRHTSATKKRPTLSSKASFGRMAQNARIAAA